MENLILIMPMLKYIVGQGEQRVMTGQTCLKECI